MNDIKLLEICPVCGSNITLMESVRVEDGQLCLVKRCLNCFQYPIQEMVEVKTNN
jgi:rRNA maturation protein Nop10